MRIRFYKSLLPLQPLHGPQAWPWWKLMSFKIVKTTVVLPSTGYRLWIYSRWGAIHFDVTFDRRDSIVKRWNAAGEIYVTVTINWPRFFDEVRRLANKGMTIEEAVARVDMDQYVTSVV